MAPIARQRRPRGEPAAQRIVAAAPLAAPRSLVQAVALPDDRVLRFGGEGEGGAYVPQVLVYE